MVATRPRLCGLLKQGVPTAPDDGWARVLTAKCGHGRGQAMVEGAVALPMLLLSAIALVQFSIFVHARHVIMAAVQDGARVAAATNRTLGEGAAHTRALLDAGLGRSATGVEVRAYDWGDTVAIEAHGRLRTMIPWTADATLPLEARSVVSKERFRAGPSGAGS